MRAMFLGVVVTGLWAAATGIQYVVAPATRYRAEAAWFLFVAALLLWALVTRRGTPVLPAAVAAVSRREQVAGLLLLIAASIALYSPILSIGLLSDDFVLLQRARGGALLDRGWEFVRPLPMAAWHLVDRALPPALLPPALHLLNVAMHGVNAWLVALCASRLGLSRAASVLAALLFLSSPLAVEPVAWASGIFDLVLTASVLAAGLVVLDDRMRPAVQIGLVSLCTLIAIASKETAVAMPLLLGLMAPFVARHRRTALLWAGLASFAIAGVYMLWRLSIGVDTGPIVPTSGYEVKEIFSRPFGALGLPVHRGVIPADPVVAFAFAVFWPAAFVLAARSWNGDRRPLVVLLVAALWVLVSIIPLSAMFFVGLDLQGSRYLYLASALWSVATLVVVAGAAPRLRPSGVAVLTVLIAASAALVLAHQRPWIQAGVVRDQVLAAFAGVASRCAVAQVSGLPDQVHGAYVFRNGFAAATPPPSGDQESCIARWTGAGFRIER